MSKWLNLVYCPYFTKYNYMYIFWKFLVHINPSPGYNTHLMQRTCKMMSSTFWHISFEDASTGWSECVLSLFDSLTPLKLLGPKLYLVVGRWNITVYSFHPFMDLFQFFPFLCEEFYHGTKHQILRIFIVDLHAIVSAFLLLPTLMSDWFVNLAATCQDMSQPARARSQMV